MKMTSKPTLEPRKVGGPARPPKPPHPCGQTSSLVPCDTKITRTLKREDFHDAREGDLATGAWGYMHIGEQPFFGSITGYRCQECAWRIAQEIQDFFDTRFGEIEDYIRETLVPEEGITDSFGLTIEEATAQIVEGIKTTQGGQFLVYDNGDSKFYCRGPAFGWSDGVEIHFDEDGELLRVCFEFP